VLPAAVVCTALVGTVSTWTTWLTTMLAVAETPGLIELLVSLSCAVTPKVATPDVMVAAGEMGRHLAEQRGGWARASSDGVTEFKVLLPVMERTVP